MSSSTELNNKKTKTIYYNQYKLLYLIDAIHRRRILNHIKKFMIWMI